MSELSQQELAKLFGSTNRVEYNMDTDSMDTEGIEGMFLTE